MTQATPSAPFISAVVPIYDEVESLRELHRRLTAVLVQTERPYEILFIDDGSTDGTPQTLAELASSDPHTGHLRFRRNFGKAAALDCGFRYARGDIVVTLDGDLQDEPAEIPRFLEKLSEGYDLVSGWKKVRRDPLSKTLPSRLFNAVARRVSRLSIHDFNCGFKAYRREAVEDLRLYGELHRFIPLIAHWQGFRVTEIPVQHHPRQSGRSKYGASRLFKGFFDLLTVILTTRYVSRPLHLFGAVGLFFSLIGFGLLAYLSVLWLCGGGPIGTRPLLFLGLLALVVGVQFVSTGLLGELLVHRSRGSEPPYVVQATRLPGRESTR